LFWSWIWICIWRSCHWKRSTPRDKSDVPWTPSELSSTFRSESVHWTLLCLTIYGGLLENCSLDNLFWISAAKIKKGGWKNNSHFCQGVVRPNWWMTLGVGHPIIF
jgi:hypothetical protein